jgi:Na+-translocating ferredoxin:NAD+ oxidoreductase RnfG subunit
MKKRKGYVIGLIVIVLLIGFFTWQAKFSGIKQAEGIAKDFFSESIKIEENKKDVRKAYIKKNFPAVKKNFICKDKNNQVLGNIFIAEPIGYKGPVTIAVVIDSQKKETMGIKILNHDESPDYGGVLTEKWFLDRFKEKSIATFLNLVKLDAKDPQDIIQITGATVTSQAVVNGVNAAIGAFNYLTLNQEMFPVAQEVSRNTWTNEMESFFINGGKKGRIKITMDELKKLPTVKTKCILKKSTGTEIEVTAEGPTLEAVLKKLGENLKSYKGIGVTGIDGYYAMISKEIIDKRQIILAYNIDGKPIIEEERPFRIVIPNEMGVYWVKMVNTIDLYENIAEKNIRSVKMFDALTRDIEPYLYEYYGSKDESIEIGKILNRFNHVDKKGFFTMASSDGLVKNETIAMVSQRYYIKTTGKNAPMNIAPNFKLGMNVKHMAYFSTTEDAVIFPKEMIKLTGTKKIGKDSGMPLDQVMNHIGVLDAENKNFELVGTNGEKILLTGKDLDQCILTLKNEKIVTAICKTAEGLKVIEDVLEINKR